METIYNSEKCNGIFRLFPLDLSTSVAEMAGTLTLRKLRNLARVMNELRKLQKKENFDTYYLTIAQSTYGSLRDVLLLRQIYRKGRLDTRVVIHLHGGGFKAHYAAASGPLKMLLRKYIGRVDCAIVLSPCLADQFDGLVDRDRISIIPNCVDDACCLSEETVAGKCNAVAGAETINVVYLSNFVVEKGYQDLLDAACLLKGLKLRFLFAGEHKSEKMRNAFERQIVENGLQNMVHYLGIVSGKEKLDLLWKGHIFVLPTYYPNEGQPISILEAMAAGMAPVVTRQAGIVDIIREGENGLFVRKKAPREIADAIKRLYEDRELLAKIGSANYLEVSRKYRESQYVDAIIRALDPDMTRGNNEA